MPQGSDALDFPYHVVVSVADNPFSSDFVLAAANRFVQMLDYVGVVPVNADLETELAAQS